MMELGFTGSRRGMTFQQLEKVRSVLRWLGVANILKVHHGDCTGSDKQFDDLAIEAHLLRVAWPPKDPKYRAYCEADLIMPEMEYLDRDWEIAKACDLLIAAPATFDEVRRSGTWATVRRAIAEQKQRIMVFPDGSAKYYNQYNETWEITLT
jgi:hypothetical protein